jgi:hypothetical protein
VLTIGEKQECFMIRHRDWNHVYDRVSEIQNPIPWATSVAFTCIGIAVSALLAVFTWLPAYQALPASERTSFAWVTPALVITTAGMALLALGLFMADRQVRTVIARDKTHVLEDMDHIYDPFRPKQDPDKDPLSAETDRGSNH